MGIGVSIFLIAVGAVLAFGVTADTEGVDIGTVGIVLMAIGAVGLLFTALVLGAREPVRRRRVVEDPYEPVAPATRRRVVEERRYDY